MRLQVHMAQCQECAERYAAECELSASMGVLRARARRIADEDRPLAWAHREALMRDFEWRHRRSFSWGWALAAAAALVLAIGAGHELGVRTKSPAVIRPAVVHGNGTHENDAAQPYVYQVSNDAGSLTSDDFIAVPFEPPLATGERITLVRVDLYPEQLASMGIDVDPSLDELPADVVMGEDGFPRAVRIAETSEF